MTKIDGRSIRNNFTIMELLVVIAIIGILMTILVPSLSTARQASYQAVCKSNEKQLGMLFQLYVIQNDHYYPMVNSSNEYISWDDMLSDYDGRFLTATEKGEWQLTNTENTDAYKCPASIQQRNGNLTLMTYGINSTKVFNYPGPNPIRGISGFIAPADGGIGWSVSQRKIVKTEKSLALMEVHTFSNIMGHATAEGYITLGHYTYRYSPNHEERLHSEQIGGNAGLFIHDPKGYRMHYLFTDGHVAFKSASDLLGDAYPNFVSGTYSNVAAQNTSWNILD